MYCTGRRESSQKQPHRESGRRAQLFPQLVWVYTVDSACPLASALTPCTFRCNGAQSKSLTRAHGDGGGMGGGTGAGYPLSSFTVCSLVKATGGRGGTGRGKGTLQVFCFYKWELSNSTFSRLSSSILGTPGGFNRAHREDESHDSHSCLWCL